MHVLRSALIAISMYTRIPVPAVHWESKDLRYVFAFFPLIGAFIGAVSWLWFFVCMKCFGSIAGEDLLLFRPDAGLLYPAVLSVIPLFVTGGIHLDGFMDTQDALKSFQSRDRRLEILSDPHIGAFSIISTIVLGAFYFGSMTILSGEELIALLLIYVLGRGLSALSVLTFPQAKDDGTVAHFADNADKGICLAAIGMELAVTALLLLQWNLLRGALVLLVACISFAYYYFMSRRIFAGITGDVCGWFLCVCETACMFIMALTVRLG